MYYGNWKAYRQACGHWGPSDEKRATRYTLPSESARKVFDTDTGIQRLLVSRDKRLPQYREKLLHIISTHTSPTFTEVLQDFLLFCNAEYPNAYKWKASFGSTNCIFPGRDTWAIWLSLRDLWTSLQ